MLNFMLGSISKRSIVAFLLLVPGVLQAQAPVPTPRSHRADPGDCAARQPFARLPVRSDESGSRQVQLPRGRILH